MAQALPFRGPRSSGTARPVAEHPFNARLSPCRLVSPRRICVATGCCMDSDGAVHIPSTPTHRWVLSPAQWRARAARPFDADARRFFWDLRWRRQAPQPVRAALVLLGVALLHVLALALLRHGSVPDFKPVAEDYDSPAMQARLIEPPPAPNLVPVQVLTPVQAAAPARPVRPPRPVATPRQPMAATLEATPMSTSMPKIYDRRGDIVLPDMPVSATSALAADYHPYLPQGSEKLMHPHQPRVYTPTKLEKRFLAAGEDPLSKAVRKTTLEHTFNLPFGIHIHCAIAPLALAGGCAPVPPKQMSAPLVVEHKRDNFAPATPLIPKADKPAKAATVPPSSQ